MAASIDLTNELRRALEEVAAEARGRGQSLTSLEFLRALLGAPVVGRALEAVGVPPDRIAQAVVDAIARSGLDDDDEAAKVRAFVGRAAQRIVACGGDRVDFTDALIAMAEETGCAGGALLAAHGVAPLPLMIHVAHPDAGPSPTFGAAAPVAIVLHDDPFTPQELVVDILMQHFAASRDAATAKMKEIQARGQAPLAQLPFAEAEQLAGEITRLARERGFPLRVSIEPSRD